jgi:hypothetical protein
MNFLPRLILFRPIDRRTGAALPKSPPQVNKQKRGARSHKRDALREGAESDPIGQSVASITI